MTEYWKGFFDGVLGGLVFALVVVVVINGMHARPTTLCLRDGIACMRVA